MSGRSEKYTAMQKDREKEKGENSRGIECNPYVFTSCRMKTRMAARGKDNHDLPIDFHYPIPIPYDLCTLTK